MIYLALLIRGEHDTGKVASNIKGMARHVKVEVVGQGMIQAELYTSVDAEALVRAVQPAGCSIDADITRHISIGSKQRGLF